MTRRDPAHRPPLARLQVAFFRNLNLGQARSKSPTSGQLLAAFGAAGASAVQNFQTNGTVIFAADDPAAVLAGVSRELSRLTGYSDHCVVRAAAWVLELAPRLDPGLPGGEVALFDAAAVPRLGLPWLEPERGLLTILEFDERHAVTSWSDPTQGSSSNPVLTAMVGAPVTCRGIPTMLRLSRRLAGQAPLADPGYS